MKKFKFTMQTILDVRQSLREARELELALARMALAKEQERLEALCASLADALSPEKIKDVSDACFFIQRERYLKRLRDAKKSQQRKVSEASAAADVALSKLKDAIIEVKKMDRAKDRQHDRWGVEFRRDEQKTNDETASTRAHARILAGSFE